MAIRIAVTTSPCPRLLSTPNADIGATGCSTITPYMMRSHSVSVRRRRGPEFMPVSLLKRLSFCSGFSLTARRSFYSIVSILTVLRTLTPQRNDKKLPALPCVAYPDFLPFFVLLFGTGSEIHRKCRLSYFCLDCRRNTGRLFVV